MVSVVMVQNDKCTLSVCAICPNIILKLCSVHENMITVYFFFPADTFSFLVPRTFFWRFFLSFLCFLAAFFFSKSPSCVKKSI